MYDLGNPDYQILLLAIPLLLVFFIFYIQWKKRAIKQFIDQKLYGEINSDQSQRKGLIKFTIRLIAILLLIIGLLNPKIGTRLETVTREGVDVVFALDVSKSMLAEDVAPNRLLKAKHILSKAIDQLINDRVGIIIYAGKAYAQLPLTTDYTAAKMFLKNISTDRVPTQGTDIAKAVEMSLSYFESGTEQNRTLFILSDGESHEDGALEAAELASSNGIIINSISLGTAEGGPIPIKQNGIIKSYKKDKDDKVVVTKMDIQTLQQISLSTGGSFIHGIHTNESLDFIKAQLDKMEKVESETELYSDYEDQFQWFLILSLALFVIDYLIPNRKTIRIRKSYSCY